MASVTHLYHVGTNCMLLPLPSVNVCMFYALK